MYKTFSLYLCPSPSSFHRCSFALIPLSACVSPSLSPSLPLYLCSSLPLFLSSSLPVFLSSSISCSVCSAVLFPVSCFLICLCSVVCHSLWAVTLLICVSSILMRVCVCV